MLRFITLYTPSEVVACDLGKDDLLFVLHLPFEPL